MIKLLISLVIVFYSYLFYKLYKRLILKKEDLTDNQKRLMELFKKDYNQFCNITKMPSIFKYVKEKKVKLSPHLPKIDEKITEEVKAATDGVLVQSFNDGLYFNSILRKLSVTNVFETVKDLQGYLEKDDISKLSEKEFEVKLKQALDQSFKSNGLEVITGSLNPEKMDIVQDFGLTSYKLGEVYAFYENKELYRFITQAKNIRFFDDCADIADMYRGCKYLSDFGYTDLTLILSYFYAAQFPSLKEELRAVNINLQVVSVSDASLDACEGAACILIPTPHLSRILHIQVGDADIGAFTTSDSKIFLQAVMKSILGYLNFDTVAICRYSNTIKEGNNKNEYV